ncbi:MAG: alpha/beta hydrolase-fold protein [Anaerolineales bacterium]|nr:alpha/beta hydrolase-fold protein [Anaerolineales bacterium]
MRNERNVKPWTLCLVFVLTAITVSCAQSQIPQLGEPPGKATATATRTASITPSAPALVPAPSSTPAICLAENGRLIEESYDLPGGTNTAPVKIYLPPCYEKSEEDLPAAYFLHGHPQDEEHWIELGVLETYEALYSLGKIEPMILIFPFLPEPYFTQSDGGPSSLEEVVLDHLVKMVNSEYRTSAAPSDQAILGISRGGVWALEIGFRHPEVFDIVGALSPALAYNHPRRAYDPFIIAQAEDELPSNILISVGDREPQFADEVDRFARQLAASDIDFTYIQHEGRHEDDAWKSILEQVFQFVGDALRASRTLVLG